MYMKIWFSKEVCGKALKKLFEVACVWVCTRDAWLVIKHLEVHKIGPFHWWVCWFSHIAHFFILIQWENMETVLLHVLNWYELPNVIVMKQIFIYLGPTRHLYKLLSIDALRGSFGQPWLFIWERLCNVLHQFLDTNLTTVVPGQPWPAMKNLMTSDIISFS